MKIRNQSGFAAVEAVLVVIVLGIVGFTGYYVYHAKQNTDKTLNVSNKDSVSPVPKHTTSKPTNSTSSSSKPKTLAIKEWGVEIPLSADILDAYYVGPYNVTDGAYIKVGTHALAALDSGCAADGPAFTSISRETVSAHEQNFGNGPDQNNTLVGNYYYGFYSAQAACSNNDTANQAQLKMIQAFKQQFASIRSVN